jgi:hypothetical protein
MAKFLRIPERLIVKVRCWAYIVFVHRQDRGGQFISYRALELWKNAIAHQIQKSRNLEELQQVGIAIKLDAEKYAKQYRQEAIEFLRQRWAIRREELLPT